MSGQQRSLVRDWLPAVALMALIFWLSSQSEQPRLPDGTLDFLARKMAHVIVYSALALSYLRGVRDTRKPFLLALFLTILYAASDEIHQSMVPKRGPAVTDVMLDSAAGAVMLAMARRAISRGEGALRAAVQVVTGL